MNKSTRRTRPDGFAALHAVFADACGPGDDDRLNPARAAALHGFVALFQRAWPRPIAVRKCLYDVWQTLSAVESSGLLPPPAPPLTQEQEDALADCFV